MKNDEPLGTVVALRGSCVSGKEWWLLKVYHVGSAKYFRASSRRGPYGSTGRRGETWQTVPWNKLPVLHLEQMLGRAHEVYEIAWTVTPQNTTSAPFPATDPSRELGRTTRKPDCCVNVRSSEVREIASAQLPQANSTADS